MVSLAGPEGDSIIPSYHAGMDAQMVHECPWPSNCFPGTAPHRKITALDSRRENYGLFRDPSDRVPWDREVEGSGTQGSWVMSKDHPLIQEQSIPTKKI